MYINTLLCQYFILYMQIYVVDSSDEQRLDEAGEELGNLLAEEKLAKIPLLVYANKQDLDLAEPPDTVRTYALCSTTSLIYLLPAN